MHVPNKQEKNLLCKCKDTKEKNQELVQKWFKNQNVNAYYTFLGVHYFS